MCYNFDIINYSYDKPLDIKNVKSPFNIRLEVIDGESQKILANTELSIITDTGVYGIKK